MQVNYDPDALFNAYLPSIHKLNYPNNKLYITFSAVTGSGKTWLANKIAEHFSGLYLSADDVRRTALELYPEISRQDLDQLIASFAPSIQDRLLHYPNQMHIVDTNIDKYAQQVFAKAKSIRFPLLIIRIDVGRATLEKRIITRPKNKFQNEKIILESLTENLDYHDKFLTQFGDKIGYNYLYTDKDALSRLFEYIDSALLKAD